MRSYLCAVAALEDRNGSVAARRLRLAHDKNRRVAGGSHFDLPAVSPELRRLDLGHALSFRALTVGTTSLVGHHVRGKTRSPVAARAPSMPDSNHRGIKRR